MTRLIVSRLIQMPLILAVVFAVTFTLAWVIPGNPLEGEGRRPPPEVQEAMLRQYNLHSPWAFAGSYLSGLVVGTEDHAPPYFGPSLAQRNLTVNEILAGGLPVSVTIGMVALILGLLIGLGAGVIGALYPRSALDMSSTVISLVGISLPSFVTATVLLVLLWATLGFLPTGGWEWPGWQFWTLRFWDDARDMVGKVFLPALTLSLAPAAYIARLIRLGLADVMRSDFVRTARAKGVDEARVVTRHAMKVAFLPVLSFLGPAAATTMTGSFVVEQVFEVPGIGREFVNAVRDKDQFLILGIVVVYAAMLVVFNLMVDVAYAWIDPRIRVA